MDWDLPSAPPALQPAPTPEPAPAIAEEDLDWASVLPFPAEPASAAPAPAGQTAAEPVSSSADMDDLPYIDPARAAKIRDPGYLASIGLDENALRRALGEDRR